MGVRKHPRLHIVTLILSSRLESVRRTPVTKCTWWPGHFLHNPLWMTVYHWHGYPTPLRVLIYAAVIDSVYAVCLTDHYYFGNLLWKA